MVNTSKSLRESPSGKLGQLLIGIIAAGFLVIPDIAFGQSGTSLLETSSGSLIAGHTYCGEYEMIGGSGSTICAEWVHTVEIEALHFAVRAMAEVASDIGHAALAWVVYGGLFLLTLRYFWLRLTRRKNEK